MPPAKDCLSEGSVGDRRTRIHLSPAGSVEREPVSFMFRVCGSEVGFFEMESVENPKLVMMFKMSRMLVLLKRHMLRHVHVLCRL